MHKLALLGTFQMLLLCCEVGSSRSFRQRPTREVTSRPPSAVSSVSMLLMSETAGICLYNFKKNHESIPSLVFFHVWD